jgi:fatty acid-binding protein DegV
MEYLVKGGRCSQLASFFASVLKINPMLQLVDGKIVVGAKYRGNMLMTGERYVKDILKQYDHPDKTRVFITYTKNTPDALVDKIEQTLRENSDFKEVIRTYAGTTVTCHCGAGTIGILYINDGE